MKFDLANNVSLETIKTTKFKHTTVKFYFYFEYDEKLQLALHVLSELLGEYTNNYQTKKDMSFKKDMLYGARVSSVNSALNNLNCLSVNFTFLNNKYTKDITLAEQLDFIKDGLFNILLNEDLVNEIKYRYLDQITRYLDNPASYVKNKVIKLIGKDNRIIKSDVDMRDLVDELNLDVVKKAYDKLINHSSINIYALGDFDEKEIYEEFRIFNFKDHPKYEVEHSFLEIDDLKVIEEEKDISQSYINLIYQTTRNDYDKTEAKWVVALMILGLSPSSMLFKEVREKRSLCYAISASFIPDESLVKVGVSTSLDKIEETISAIKEVIEKMQKGEFSLVDLESSKDIIINTLNSTYDSAKSWIAEVNKQSRTKDKTYSFENYLKDIENVSKDEVIEVMNTFNLKLTYILKGVC